MIFGRKKDGEELIALGRLHDLSAGLDGEDGSHLLEELETCRHCGQELVVLGGGARICIHFGRVKGRRRLTGCDWAEPEQP